MLIQREKPIVKVGATLFKCRRGFYAIPIVILTFISGNLNYPFGNYYLDETLEFICFAVVLLGLTVRFLASGSSHRGFVKKRERKILRFQSHGIFSIVRNPFFLGDFMIIFGLSLLLFDPLMITLSLSLFLLLYQSILFAREEVLLQCYGDRYAAYCQKVPLFFPSFRYIRRRRARFRWLLGLQKEGNLIGVMGLLFIFMEQIREFSIQGHWNANPLWILLLIPFFVLWLLLRVFDAAIGECPNIPAEFPD